MRFTGMSVEGVLRYLLTNHEHELCHVRTIAYVKNDNRKEKWYRVNIGLSQSQYTSDYLQPWRKTPEQSQISFPLSLPFQCCNFNHYVMSWASAVA